MFIHFSGNQESIISFIKIKNLIKNLLSLMKLPISTPQNKTTYFARLKKGRFLLAGVYCISIQ